MFWETISALWVIRYPTLSVSFLAQVSQKGRLESQSHNFSFAPDLLPGAQFRDPTHVRSLLSGYCEVLYPIGAQVSKPKYNGLIYRRFWAISWLSSVGFPGVGCPVSSTPREESCPASHAAFGCWPHEAEGLTPEGCMPEVATHIFLPALASPSSQHPTLFSYTLLLLGPSLLHLETFVVPWGFPLSVLVAEEWSGQLPGA